jgi:inhibitor of cysteine peptidase
MKRERSIADINALPGKQRRRLLGSSIALPLGVSLLLLLSGCTLGSSVSTLRLTASDANKTFQIQPGTQVVITLDANPTTGYDWDIDQTNSAILDFQGKVFQATVNGPPGSGGTDTFTFKALAAGTVNLRLKYWRSFAGPTSIINRYAVTLQVL